MLRAATATLIASRRYNGKVNASDTIVAISTPPGRGGIGIVRLSGAQAIDIARRLLELHSPLEHGRARLTWILDPDAAASSAPVHSTRIDQAVVTYFAAPHSYTAEEVVEIAAHGSPVVLELLLRGSIACGARLAEPGEFTQRAFLAGHIDLTQAEAVHDLIAAHTLTQARQAASQMGGALSHRVAPIKQNLLALIALLEAGIDFAEDDVDVAPQAEIARRIDDLVPALTALEASFVRGRIVHDGLSLAIVGRPNVGKSSLFNRLVERDRAIVAPNPGTTRDTITERISLGGIPIEVVDTAGLRDTLEEVEQLGIERSHEALADAALVLIILDATHPLHSDERRLLESLEHRPVLVVMNKSDLTPSGTASHENLPAALPVLRTSALTGDGLPALRNAIVSLATGGAAIEPGVLTSLRHQEAILGTLEGLSRAADANRRGIPHEMLLLDLYQALAAMDSLTGQTTNEDILTRIFSTFCIGK